MQGLGKDISGLNFALFRHLDIIHGFRVSRIVNIVASEFAITGGTFMLKGKPIVFLMLPFKSRNEFANQD
jgi:hypothetical protein